MADDINPNRRDFLKRVAVATFSVGAGGAVVAPKAAEGKGVLKSAKDVARDIIRKHTLNAALWQLSEVDALRLAGEHGKAKKIFDEAMQVMLTSLEGKESEQYQCTEGKPTIGIGFNMEGAHARDQWQEALGKDAPDFDACKQGLETITSRQVQALFHYQIDDMRHGLRNRIGKEIFDGLAAHQQAALFSMYFNHPSLVGDAVVSGVRAGNHHAVGYDICMKNNPDRLAGVQNRRAFEAALYMNDPAILEAKSMESPLKSDAKSGISGSAPSMRR